MKTIQDVLAQFIQAPENQDAYQKRLTYILKHPQVVSFLSDHQDQIDQTMIKNSVSKLNEFVTEVEAQAKGKQSTKPGFIPHLFIHDNFIDVTYHPSPAFIEEQAKRQVKARIDNRMMSRDVREARFEDLYLDHPSRQVVINQILAFVEKLKKSPDQAKGLYLAGSFGIGKTYILGALANRLAAIGYQVHMLHYPTFAHEMKDAIRNHAVASNIDQVKKKQILIIDDIGAETNSSWLRDEVLGVILEYRMKESLPTFFTSNFSMEDLLSHLAESRDASESIKAMRLMQRIQYLATEVRMEGDNLRLQERMSK